MLHSPSFFKESICTKDNFKESISLFTSNLQQTKINGVSSSVLCTVRLCEDVIS